METANVLSRRLYDETIGQGHGDLVKIVRTARRINAEWLQTMRDWRFVEEVQLLERPATLHPDEWADALRCCSAPAAPAWRTEDCVQASSDTARVPDRYAGLFEAANACSAVAALTVTMAAGGRRGVGMIGGLKLNSKGLGGVCNVTGLRMVSGHFAVPAGRPPGACLTLLEPARRWTEDGRPMYKHCWLEADVTAPDGQAHVVSIDATAAQFGYATTTSDLAVWHDRNPSAGAAYLCHQRCTSEQSMVYLAEEIEKMLL